MLNLNMNNDGKKNTFISDRLDNYYKKAKEDIKRANILFPSMKDRKDAMEDEINEWEESKKKSNSIAGNNISIKIPKEETEEERTMRLANSLYPTMKDKNEKEKKNTNSLGLDALFSKKEQTKLSLDKEVPKFVNFGSGLFAEDKRPLRKQENKEGENKYFDINNKPKLNYQDEIKKIANKKEEKPLTLKEPILKTNTNQEKGKYVYSENKSYQPKHDAYRELAIDSYSKTGNNIKDYKPILESENKDTGFSSRAYLDDKNKTIVIAYRGSDQFKKDWIDNDFSMASNSQIPQQFSDAENFYKDIKDKLGDKAKDYKIVFTGHSLGGTLAELMGAKYGDETVTFNAYGANQMKDAKINYRDNITNYGHIKDKVFNAPFSSHIGNVVNTNDSQSFNWPFKNHHKAENIGDLSKEVIKNKDK